MQLMHLVKPLEEMTDEELRARLHELRHRRDVERPAAKAHVKKEKKKVARKEANAAEKLLAELTPEQLAMLMKELGA